MDNKIKIFITQKVQQNATKKHNRLQATPSVP